MFRSTSHKIIAIRLHSARRNGGGSSEPRRLVDFPAWLLNMSPIGIVNDCQNHKLANLKPLGSGRSTMAPDAIAVGFSDGQNIGFGQFCHSMARTFCLSVLSIAVFVVGFFRSSKQVARAAAGRIIAVVKNRKPFRNGAVVKQVRKPVNVPELFLHTGNTVSEFVFRSAPNPARAKFRVELWDWTVLVKFVPEVIRCSCVLRHPGTVYSL